MADDKIPSSYQESVATCVALINDNNSQAIAATIDITLFDPPFDDIVARALAYRKKYNTPMGKGHIDDEFSHILDNTNHKSYQLYSRIIDGMVRQSDSINTQYVADHVSDFNQMRSYRQSIGEAAERYQKGGAGAVDEIEAILRKSLQIKRKFTESIDFSMDDSGSSLAFLDKNETNYCKLGIPELDDYGVHPTKNELLGFLAARNKGKCFDGNTRILLGDGQYKKIKDVVKDRDPEVVAYDIDKEKFVISKIINYWNNGKKRCYQISTKSGYSIIVTENHPLLTPQGWEPLKNIVVGNYIAVARNLSKIGHLKDDPDKLRLLGYLISDGCFRQSWIGYTKNDPDVVSDVKYCVEKLGCQLTITDKAYLISGNPKWSINTVLNLIREIGLDNKKSNEKFVPELIFQQTDEGIIEFLRGLFTGDSSYYLGNNKDVVFEYSSASSRLAKDVRHLLLRLGISTTYKPHTAKLKGIEINGYGKLYIKSKKEFAKFVDLINPMNPYAHKLRREHCELQINKRRYGTLPLSNIADYEVITEIKDIGMGYTYDIEVTEHHNLVAENIIAHNSWFLALCGKMGLMQGWKVLHYTLENSADMTAMRYWQTLYSGVRREGDYRAWSFEVQRDDSVDMVQFPLKPKFIIQNTDKTRDFLLNKIKDPYGMASKLANLRICQFPTGKLSYEGMERHLDELSVVHNFRPDMIMIDSPQLMRLSRHGQIQDHTALDELVINLRGLMMERNAAGVITHQGTRAGETAGLMEGQHGSGSIGILAIVDNYITYSQTKAEEEHGLARLMTAKVRNDSARHIIMITQHYASGQFVISSHRMTKQLAEMIKKNTGDKDSHDDDDEVDSSSRMSKQRAKRASQL